MLKMKLPIRTAEEGDDTAEDEQEQAKHVLRSVSPSASERHRGCTGEGHPLRLSKETVFEWFGLHLNSAKRIEFMYGLLHMCQPLELRFLGSCLEDLARKDYYVLRDCEIRANSQSDVGLLSDVFDPVVRSKLLVFLSLLGSDNRECAGILFRILDHVDPALRYRNGGLPISTFRDPTFLPLHHSCEDGDDCGRSEQGCSRPTDETGAGLLEQLALLFTMASLHPAFPFHQRDTLHGQLEKVELAMEEQAKLKSKQAINIQNKTPRQDYLSPITEVRGNERGNAFTSPQSPHRRTPREAVHIEKIVLRGISRNKTEREYNFEVKWSDSTSSNVTKTQLDLGNFLLKLPKEHSTESFERSILRLLNQGEKYEQREVERNIKEKFLSAPPAFRQTRKVCTFFHCDSRSSANSYSKWKGFKEDCSEASSQEEDPEPCVQGHRKKANARSPNPSVPNSRLVPSESHHQHHQHQLPHSNEHNGLPEWRRKGSGSGLKLSPEPSEQHSDDRRSSSLKGKSRAPPPVREKGKTVGEGRASIMANGISSSPRISRGNQSEGKEVYADLRSGQDAFGETSSDSYDGRESLDSEEEKDKDTDSHSDDCAKVDSERFLQLQGIDLPSSPSLLLAKQPQLEPALGPPMDFPPMPFGMPPAISYILPNGAEGAVTGAAGAPPLPGMGNDTKGLMMTQAVMLPSPGPGEVPTDVAPLPSFSHPGLGMGLPSATGPSLQPLVQRFKTAGPQGMSESGSGPQGQSPLPPMGAVNINPASLSSYGAPLQPAYPGGAPGPGPDSMSMASMQISPDPLTKPPSIGLPSALPPPSYSLSIPTSLMPTGHAPTVVPTHTPGPAPSPSPALTHSTAQSDSTSYINSSTCGSNTMGGNGLGQQQQPPPMQSQQQVPPPPQHQQQPMGCGACGCRGSCGGPGTNSGGGGHLPSYYIHQMAPARQIFPQVPHIFPLSSLCSTSYLSQGAPQASNAAGQQQQQQLSFFPQAAATAATYPGGALLHTHAPAHAQTHSEHMLGGQAAAVAAAAANYGFQQMAAFTRGFYPQMYPTTMGPLQAAAAPGGGGGGHTIAGVLGINKKNGNISCYNCGASGHIAQDCKQPSLDSTQQGGFRLKYATSHNSEALDNSEG